jgi:hypothetical protein
MRIGLFALAVVAGGCLHRGNSVQRPEEMVELTVGYTHAPYLGKPAYLASSRPLQQVAPAPQQQQDNPCAQRSSRCDDRLRALLAAVDGQLLALATPPRENELQALNLSLADLPPLLAPYTDVTAEADELISTACKLPEATAIDRDSLKKRMHELVDLIRVQLAAAQ